MFDNLPNRNRDKALALGSGKKAKCAEGTLAKKIEDEIEIAGSLPPIDVKTIADGDYASSKTIADGDYASSVSVVSFAPLASKIEGEASGVDDAIESEDGEDSKSNEVSEEESESGDEVTCSAFGSHDAGRNQNVKVNCSAMDELIVNYDCPVTLQFPVDAECVGMDEPHPIDKVGKASCVDIVGGKGGKTAGMAIDDGPKR
ncbi:hypothetical protein U1Q18_032756, partial [Sarracenia purpurea var. burkii]